MNAVSHKGLQLKEFNDHAIILFVRNLLKDDGPFSCTKQMIMQGFIVFYPPLSGKSPYPINESGTRKIAPGSEQPHTGARKWKEAG